MLYKHGTDFAMRTLSSKYLFKIQQGTIMNLSKTPLVMALAALSLGLSACTDTQKESAQEVESEAKEMAIQAKEKSVELYDKTKAGASELADNAADMAGDVKESTVEAYEEVKDKASEAYDATAEKASGLKSDAARKLKDACIASKEKLGKDPKDC